MNSVQLRTSQMLTHSKRTAQCSWSFLDNIPTHEAAPGHIIRILRAVTSRRTDTLRPEHDGERLDRALAALFPEHSRSFLAGLIENGHVRVDTQLVQKPSYRVSSGQSVEIEVPPPVPASA